MSNNDITYQENGKSVTIKMFNKDAFYDLTEMAFTTIGKDTINRDATKSLLRKYMLSEHSPIRAIQFIITFNNIKSPNSVHLVRHSATGQLHFVKSSRPDRTGKERDPEEKLKHNVILNCQHLIDISRKRLCIGKCDKDTYEWVLLIKKALIKSDNIIMNILGEFLVPNCVYRAGCPEFKSCGFYDNLSINDSLSIQDRYKIYNQKT